MAHRLWWPEHELPAIGTRLGFACDLDRYADARAVAALRFWRAVTSAGHARAPPRRLERLPEPRLVRRVAVLRALDGRLAGASYRAVADVLLGSGALTPTAWKTGSLRGRAIRLVIAGRRLMDGGYRDLLKPPRRRSSRALHPPG